MTRGRRIAIVGAGISGLACARALVAGGAEVEIFDKGRGVGGRVATRRMTPHAFDLGAQYFTARDARFALLVQTLREAGDCARWEGALVAMDAPGAAQRPVDRIERFVGTPDMSAIARGLARGLFVRTSHRVDVVERGGGKLALRGTLARAGTTLEPARGSGGSPEALGSFDAVGVCLPSTQAAVLLAATCPSLAAEAAEVAFEPCVAVGAAFVGRDAELLAGLGVDGAFIGRGAGELAFALTWVARDSSKPGRPPGERWVLHASSAWSRANAGRDEQELARALVAELSGVFGVGLLEPSTTVARRWALARASRPLTQAVLMDAEVRVGLAGDWLAGGRVEGAFVSGVALAERLLA